MPKISLQKRRQVINLYKQKWKFCRISKELLIFSSTVLRIIKKYEAFGTVEDRKRPGRNRKITEKMKKIVVRTAKKRKKTHSLTLPKYKRVLLRNFCVLYPTNLSQPWSESQNMSEETSYIRCKPAKKIDWVSGKNEKFSVQKRNFFGRNNDGIATDKENFCTTSQKQAI